MRLARRVIALALCGLIGAGPASANPLAYVLAGQESAPEVVDPSASNVREAAGEPASEGELDSADLSKLAGRLSTIALGYESFPSEAHIGAESSRVLVDYTAPQGLIPNPADRVQTLDRVYRSLALLDYTRALRYAEGESCARVARRSLLRSPDGLFSDLKTGELAPWLKAELKRSRAGEAPASLQTASAREWTQLAYLKTLAAARGETRKLADQGVVGAERAGAYCRRARLHEDLASAQAALKWPSPDFSTQTEAVLEARWGDERATALALEWEGKPVIVVPGRLTPSEYEAPDLFTKSGKKISASYSRRGPTLSLLSPISAVALLRFSEKLEAGEQIGYVVGHPIQGGSWSLARGLAQPPGNGLIVTDAAIDEGQAGAPLLDAQGRLLGVVAGWGAAYDAASLRGWLKDGGTLPAVDESAPELGTGALLTASATFAPKENGGLIEAGSYFNTNPTGKCVDVRGCDPAPPSGGSSYAPNPYAGCPPTQCYPAFMAPVMGLFGLIGKALKSRPRAAAPRVADRGETPKRVEKKEPERLPDPKATVTLLPVSVKAGEEIVFQATVKGNRKEMKTAGLTIDFTVEYDKETKSASAVTDASGVAVLKIKPSPAARSFADLNAESAKHPNPTNAAAATPAQKVCEVVLPGAMILGVLTATAVLAPTPAGVTVAYAGGSQCLMAATGVMAGTAAFCAIEFGKQELAPGAPTSQAPDFVVPKRQPSTKKPESPKEAAIRRAEAAQRGLDVEAGKHSDSDSDSEMAGGQSADPNEPPEDPQEGKDEPRQPGKHKYSGKSVSEILAEKRAGIKNAPLEDGSPSWKEFAEMTWEDIVSGARARKPGFRTVRKLLTDSRFDKP